MRAPSPRRHPFARGLATRREALRIAGAAAALVSLGAAHPVLARAQNATPGATPGAAGSKEGRYAVLRTRTLKPDASVDELSAAIREDFVPVIRRIPGFVEYYVVQNAETRGRTSVSIFADRAGADESTRAAGEFLRGEGLADLYEDVTPVVQEGTIVVFAGEGGT